MERLKAGLVLGVVLVLALGIAERTDGQPPAVKKEDLRYDGKAFEYWKEVWRTELKTERRIDVLRAMGKFGEKGFAAEATATLLDLVQEHDVKSFAKHSYNRTQESELIHEALLALAKMGPDAIAVLVEKLENEKVCQLLDYMVDEEESKPGGKKFTQIPRSATSIQASYSIKPAAIPPLMKGLGGPVGMRSTAINMLSAFGFTSEANEAAVKAALAKPEEAKACCKLLLDEAKSGVYTETGARARDILRKLGDKSVVIVPDLIADLKSLIGEVKEEHNKAFSGSYPRDTIGSTRNLAEQMIILLGSIGASAKDALPVLELYVQEAPFYLREDAIKAIDKIRGSSEKPKKTNR